MEQLDAYKESHHGVVAIPYTSHSYKVAAINDYFDLVVNKHINEMAVA